MVKVGKFQKHDLGWAMGPPATIPYGANSPNRSVWFGVLNKNTAAAATMTFNVRGPTWNFTWVDYIECHSRSHLATTAGQAAGTVITYLNHNPTVWLPVTLGVQQRCFVMIWGRHGGRS